MKKQSILLLLTFALMVNSCAQGMDPVKTYSVKGSINSLYVSGDKVSVGAEDGSVYLFDVYLRLKWRYECSDKVTSTSVSNGIVAIGSADSMLTVVGYDGKLRWKTQLDNYVEHPHALDGGEGVIAAGTRDGFVYLFGEEGGLWWKEKTDAYVLYVQVLPESIAVVSDKSIYLFDLEGTEISRTALNSYVRSAHISDSHILAGLGNNELALFDLEGRLIWNRTLLDQIGSVYASDKNAVVGMRNNALRLYDMDGDLRWENKLSDSVTRVSAKGGQVVAATLDDRLYLFSAEGIHQGSYAADGRIQGMEFSNLGLFAVTSQGEVYNFRFIRDLPSTIFVLSLMVAVLFAGTIMFLRVFR